MRLHVWPVAVLLALPVVKSLAPSLAGARPGARPRVAPPLAAVGTEGREALAARLDEVQSEYALLRAECEELRAENSRLKQAEDQRVADLLNAENLSRLARKTLLRNIATINLVVIVTFGMGIAYSLLETDIRAVFALYYFDLGSDLYPSFARSAIALDLFLRLHSSGGLVCSLTLRLVL